LTPPPAEPGLSTRERFAKHTSVPACASCHRLIDPLGFALEHFDELGRWRETDGGKPIDAGGELVGFEDPTLAGAFRDGRELAERIAKSRTAADCVAEQRFRFLMGRLALEGDACTLARAKASLRKTGDLRALIAELLASDVSRYRTLDEAEVRP
jgi:hypothetical protein